MVPSALALTVASACTSESRDDAEGDGDIVTELLWGLRDFFYEVWWLIALFGVFVLGIALVIIVPLSWVRRGGHEDWEYYEVLDDEDDVVELDRDE